MTFVSPVRMATQVAVWMVTGICRGRWLLAALMAQLALLSLIGPAWGGLRRSLQVRMDPPGVTRACGAHQGSRAHGKFQKSG